MKSLTYKCALCAIFTALAIISFMIESLFPPLFIVGARIGVSNIFILLSTLTLGVGYGFITLVIKTVLGSLFAGNISAVMYSLPAGAIALGAEVALIYLIKKVSVIAVSVVGSVLNSTVQSLVFCLITGAVEYLYYLPYLVLIAIFSGLTVGLATFITVKLLPKKLFSK